MLQDAGIVWGTVGNAFCKDRECYSSIVVCGGQFGCLSGGSLTQDPCQHKEELVKALCFSKLKDFFSFRLLQKMYQTLGRHNDLHC